MSIVVPDIAESECTPLVRQLLDIVRLQQERIQHLEDEIIRLTGLKTRPQIAPSALETPPRSPPPPDAKRPGSAKRVQERPTDDDPPRDGSSLCPMSRWPTPSSRDTKTLSFRNWSSEPQVTCDRRERWQTADGQNLVAPLPAEVLPGSHYGPDLICFALHQYHHQHVTQPLLLEQLHQLGIDISAGQLSRILTESRDAFGQEKAELLPTALAVSTYVQVDDTGARHQGHNGYCTHIGNELFACFASTDSKSRLNFLESWRSPHTDYCDQ